MQKHSWTALYGVMELQWIECLLSHFIIKTLQCYFYLLPYIGEPSAFQSQETPREQELLSLFSCDITVQSPWETGQEVVWEL